jgi:large subunit ribosomal protein L35
MTFADGRSPSNCRAPVRGPDRHLLQFVTVPKMKSHSGAKKRFRKTARDKLRGRHAFMTHKLGKKPAHRKRRLARPTEISPADRRRVRELLPGRGDR